MIVNLKIEVLTTVAVALISWLYWEIHFCGVSHALETWKETAYVMKLVMTWNQKIITKLQQKEKIVKKRMTRDLLLKSEIKTN